MVDVDLEAVARDLAKTAASLKRHIEAEGLKVGAALGKQHAKAADERIAEHVKTVGADLQRQADLVKELFRQRVPLERYSDRYGQIVTAVRKAGYAGQDTIPVKVLLDIINAPHVPANHTDTTTTNGN